MILTPREKSIADLVAKGKCDKEIAHELGLSSKFVRVYLSKLYRKVGVPNRTALAVRAVTVGFEITAPRPTAEQRVLLAIESGAQTAREICGLGGLADVSVRRALKCLLRSGQVRLAGTKPRPHGGSPIRLYRFSGRLNSPPNQSLPDK